MKKNPVEENKLLRRRTQELQTLVHVSQLINIVDLDEVLSKMLQLTTEVVDATKGSLFLVDDNQQPIQRFITQRHMPPEMSRRVARDVVQNGLAGWCIRNLRGDIVADVEKDERWYILPDDDQSDVRSALCVPLIHRNNVIGVLTLVSAELAKFDLSSLELVTAIANQTSTAIRNAQLFDSLQNKQRQLELALQNHSAGLITIDADFRVTLINPEARRLIGNINEDDVLGQRLHEITHSTLFTDIVRQIKGASQPLRSLSFNVRDEALDRDFSVTISTLKNIYDPLMMGYVMVLHDITSIKDLDRMKTEMLHMLTHDLKNPINVVWGYIDLLRADSEAGEPADPRFIDGVLRALHRMEKLIDETLKAERFASTGAPPRYEPFVAQAVVNEAIDGLMQLASRKQQYIQREISKDMSAVEAETFKIHEAMVNLISNAIKYTPQGGQIIVRAYIDEGRFIFAVEDSGIGIPEEMQSQIFSEYYRATRPATENIEGTGIGLSIVKKTVERHKGQVWFESKADVGSTFGFWIPVKSTN